jgi:hypothetical protein
MIYFITPGQNRYYLNKAQRQLIIANDLEVFIDDGGSQRDANMRESWLKNLNNKDLVEEICGNQWEGFIGQTLHFA